MPRQAQRSTIAAADITGADLCASTAPPRRLRRGIAADADTARLSDCTIDRALVATTGANPADAVARLTRLRR